MGFATPKALVTSGVPRPTRILALTCALIGLALAGCGGASPAAPDTDDAAEETEATLSGVGSGAAALDTSATTVRPFVEPAPGVWRALGEPGVGGLVNALAFDPNRDGRLLAAIDVGGVGYSADDGMTWQRSLGLTSLEVARFSFDPTRPGVVWVGTMGGPFRSADGGQTWEPRRTGMPEVSESFYTAPVELVLPDPQQQGRLLAFGGSHRRWPSLGEPAWGAVWESVDDGLSWTLRSTIGDRANVVAAVDTGDGVILVGTDQGLFRSNDRGASWASTGSGLPHAFVRDIAVHPTDPLSAWVALGSGRHLGVPATGGVYRTKNGGASWEPSGAGLTFRRDPVGLASSSYDTIVVDPLDPEILYTADTAPGAEAVYRSDDGGITWQSVLAGPDIVEAGLPYGSGPTATAISVHPDRSGHIVVGQREYLMASDDDGETWNVLSSDRTPEGGQVGRGLSGLVGSDIDIDATGTVHLAGLDGGNLWRSADGLGSWRRPLVDWDPWGGTYELARPPGPDETVLWALLGQTGVFNGIARSADGGASWDVAAGGGLPERGSRSDGAHGMVALNDGSAVALIGDGLYARPAEEDRWELVQTGLGITALTIDPANGATVLVSAGTELFSTIDGGRTLRPKIDLPVRASRLIADPGRGELYVVGWREAGGGLWRLRDGSWTHLFDEVHAYDLAIDPSDPTHLVLVTNDHPFHDVNRATGVWRSTDDGEEWTQQNRGLPVLRVTTVAFDPTDPGRLVIGTFGGGYYHLRLS